MDQSFYFKLFLRRLPYFMVFVVLGTAAGLTVATMLPSVFRAEATLAVEREQIPDEMAASTVQSGTNETLPIIRQRVLSRTRLLELANEFEIYGAPGSAERREMTPDTIVADLRRRIEITPAGNLLTVAFSASTGQMSASVANEIVTQILDENLQLRRGAAGQTLEFFENEVARLDQELTQREAEILSFQERNLEALPDSLEFRRGQQSAAQERLQQLGREEAVLRDRRNRLVDLYETTGRVSEAQQIPESGELAETYARMQMEVARARAVLAPDNPRRVAIESRAAALSDLVAEARAQASGAVNEEDAQLTLYEVQLAEIDGELEFIASQQAQLTQQMADLQVSIEATPANAIQLDSMQRDYNAVSAQYAQAVANRAAAETGDVIETLSKGQRITVIEPAVAPGAPTSPDRTLIAIGGVFGGAAMGFGFIVLLELLNSAVRRPVDLQNRLGITPFGTLPLMRTPGQVRRRRAVIALTLLAIAAAVPAGLWYVQTEVMPLDLLLERALSSVGIARLDWDEFFARPV